MDPRETPHIKAFESSLVDWVDQRFLSTEQLKALAMFSLYLVNLSEHDGWEYNGHSYKVGTPMCCLTVKSTVDGVPQVVFTSGRSHADCVVAFMRKLGEGWLEWRNDRYR